MRRRAIWAVVMLLVAAPGLRAAEWLDAGWTCRRPVDVAWDADKAAGNEVGVVEFFTAGHRGDGDIRVATDEGRILPSRVLSEGPGDRMSVVFTLIRGMRRYYLYFGNPQAPPAPPNAQDISYKSGLYMEIKAWSGGPVDNFRQMEQTWERNKDVIGAAMIDRLFLGVNPIDDRNQIMCRIRGSLFVPVDGPYEFAGSAMTRGALFLDAKPVLFIPGQTGDIRFNAHVDLKRGPHDLVFLYACPNGEPRFSVAWKRPDTPRVDVISRESFGLMGRGTAGALEERGRSLTADFAADYAGECFYDNHYSYRYHLSGANPNKNPNWKFTWDFGDGQRASGAEVDHVYLADGIYGVKVRVDFGVTNDTQTTRLGVRRDRERITRPPTDDPPVQSAIVARYDLATLPVDWLPWALVLHHRARAVEPLLAVARRLTEARGDFDASVVMDTMRDATPEIAGQGYADALVKVWDQVPHDSRLQPRAVMMEAQLLLWQTADFAKAVRVLEPFAGESRAPAALRRLYAQALILAQKTDAGAKILEDLPIEGLPERQAAISGAMARTVEYFITEGDWEAGEEAWEKWQNRYPADFLEGYSALLQTKLIELQKSPQTAAAVAAAFALALPHSSYAPQLLDRASKLLAGPDAKRSAELRAMLKEKYPEDPLSQGP